MEKHTLYMVTGASCAGKTAAMHELLQHNAAFEIFDIDWLALPASELAGKSIYANESTWSAYASLWFEVLHAAYQNGRVPVLFSPASPNDITRFGQPDWCDDVKWLLLDCPDDVRVQRMNARAWDSVRQREALASAAQLRTLVKHHIDTSKHSPSQVAARITAWLQPKSS
ncbi:MAG TPA: hypothetical protein VLA88_05535 [Candidatus Saccharimonadales bacterium]|nr:hypothetical protein [Candidatus Saccharimonadales bacterium]